MWLVYAWINNSDYPSNNTLIVYGFHDADKMVKKLTEFTKICAEKNIKFKYNVVEQKED
jgi:hypothetical protein